MGVWSRSLVGAYRTADDCGSGVGEYIHIAGETVAPPGRGLLRRRTRARLRYTSRLGFPAGHFRQAQGVSRIETIRHIEPAGCICIDRVRLPMETVRLPARVFGLRGCDQMFLSARQARRNLRDAIEPPPSPPVAIGTRPPATMMPSPQMIHQSRQVPRVAGCAVEHCACEVRSAEFA